MTMSQQRKRKSLHIFLESNYKLVPWLKKFENKYAVHDSFVHNQEIQY